MSSTSTKKSNSTVASTSEKSQKRTAQQALTQDETSTTAPVQQPAPTKKQKTSSTTVPVQQQQQEEQSTTTNEHVEQQQQQTDSSMSSDKPTNESRVEPKESNSVNKTETTANGQDSKLEKECRRVFTQKPSDIDFRKVLSDANLANAKVEPIAGSSEPMYQVKCGNQDLLIRPPPMKIRATNNYGVGVLSEKAKNGDADRKFRNTFQIIQSQNPKSVSDVNDLDRFILKACPHLEQDGKDFADLMDNSFFEWILQQIIINIEFPFATASQSLRDRIALDLEKQFGAEGKEIAENPVNLMQIENAMRNTPFRSIKNLSDKMLNPDLKAKTFAILSEMITAAKTNKAVNYWVAIEKKGAKSSFKTDEQNGIRAIRTSARVFYKPRKNAPTTNAQPQTQPQQQQQQQQQLASNQKQQQQQRHTPAHQDDAAGDEVMKPMFSDAQHSNQNAQKQNNASQNQSKLIYNDVDDEDADVRLDSNVLGANKLSNTEHNRIYHRMLKNEFKYHPPLYLNHEEQKIVFTTAPLLHEAFLNAGDYASPIFAVTITAINGSYHITLSHRSIIYYMKGVRRVASQFNESSDQQLYDNLIKRVTDQNNTTESTEKDGAKQKQNLLSQITVGGDKNTT